MSQGKMATQCLQKHARNQCLPVLFKWPLRADVKITWRGFRFIQSLGSDWLSLNTLQSFLFWSWDQKSLFSWKTQAALLSPVVHHPIIQNLHYKQQRFLLVTHITGESSSLHQCYWFCSTNSSYCSSSITKISRNAWRSWRENVTWIKDAFLQLLLCPELYFKSNLGLFVLSTWQHKTVSVPCHQVRSRAELHWQLWGCRTPSTTPVYPWTNSPSPRGILTNEINTVLPVTTFQMLLSFKKFVNE